MTFKPSSKILSQLLGRVRKKMRIHFLPKSGWVEVDRMGFHWRLDMDTYIGRMIAIHDVFEPDTTRLLADLVKPGMHVLDVGANIGYFTLLMAQAVGPKGHVWAFEPTQKYREQLLWHVDCNELTSRVSVIPFGLSDESMSPMISIGDSSATLHWTKDVPPQQQEEIELHPLDDVVDELSIQQVDLVKLDIDGHEPHFIRGAARLLQQSKPRIVLEFSQRNLYIAGSSVKDQARSLQDLGYLIYNEKTQEPYTSAVEFLIDCGNFNYSCNALAVYRGTDRKLLL